MEQITKMTLSRKMQSSLEQALCGTWIGIVADLKTRMVVKEVFSWRGRYLSEIRQPANEKNKNLQTWGTWKIANGDIRVDLQGWSNRSFFAAGDQVILRNVAIDNFVMTYRDHAGVPWVHFRVS